MKGPFSGERIFFQKKVCNETTGFDRETRRNDHNVSEKFGRPMEHKPVEAEKERFFLSSYLTKALERRVIRYIVKLKKEDIARAKEEALKEAENMGSCRHSPGPSLAILDELSLKRRRRGRSKSRAG